MHPLLVRKKGEREKESDVLRARSTFAMLSSQLPLSLSNTIEREACFFPLERPAVRLHPGLDREHMSGYFQPWPFLQHLRCERLCRHNIASAWRLRTSTIISPQCARSSRALSANLEIKPSPCLLRADPEFLGFVLIVSRSRNRARLAQKCSRVKDWTLPLHLSAGTGTRDAVNRRYWMLLRFCAGPSRFCFSKR